jgi:hypothetical protein
MPKVHQVTRTFCPNHALSSPMESLPWHRRLLQRSKGIFQRKKHRHQHREPLLVESHSNSDVHHIGASGSSAPVRHLARMHLFGSCCGGQRRSKGSRRERRHRRSRRERKHHLNAVSRTPVQHSDSVGQHALPLAATSVASGAMPCQHHMLLLLVPAACCMCRTP